MNLMCCPQHLINFSKNSNFDDSGISLPVLPSRTNVITNLDSSKASGPVMVVKNCEPELSDTLAELFIMSLKES